MIMAKLKHESKPNNQEWLLNYADGHHQMGDTKKAIACLKDAERRFCEEAEYPLLLVQVLCNSRQCKGGEEFS
jgi:hypothetical protein